MYLLGNIQNHKFCSTVLIAYHFIYPVVNNYYYFNVWRTTIVQIVKTDIRFSCEVTNNNRLILWKTPNSLKTIYVWFKFILFVFTIVIGSFHYSTIMITWFKLSKRYGVTFKFEKNSYIISDDFILKNL